MSEQNQQLIRDWVDLINERRLDRFFDVWATDFVLRAGPGFGEARSMEELQSLLGHFLIGVPDAHLTIEFLASEGDRVHMWVRSAGTHTGPFMGVAPTGKPVEMWTMGVFTVRDGKIAEEAVIDDYMSVLAQLGAVPS